MTADANLVRFYVGESALGLGKALEAARKDTIHVGHKLKPECPLGILDPDWIPAVAAHDLTVIGRDRKIRTQQAELRALMEGDIRVFRIGGSKDMPTWDWLCRLTRHWGKLEAVLRERPQGPWST